MGGKGTCGIGRDFLHSLEGVSPEDQAKVQTAFKRAKDNTPGLCQCASCRVAFAPHVARLAALECGECSGE